MLTEIETSTEHYRKLTEILGEKHLKTKVESPFDFIQIAKEGVSADVIKNFGGYFKLSRELMATMLNVSAPTLYRWTKSNKNLDRNFSVNYSKSPICSFLVQRFLALTGISSNG